MNAAVAAVVCAFIKPEVAVLINSNYTLLFNFNIQNMNQKSMLRGLSTISFYADNLEEAKKWYSELLGMEPYFEVPGYFEFRLGDYQHELGIIDKKYTPHQSENTGGAIAYWHMDDVRAVFEKLVASGATEYEQMNERGEGFITASVVDPFGNIKGIMYNQHYLHTLSTKNKD